MKTLLIFSFIGIFISSIFYFSIEDKKDIFQKVEEKKNFEENKVIKKNDLEAVSNHKVIPKKIFSNKKKQEDWVYIYKLAEKRGYEKHYEEKKLLKFKSMIISSSIKNDLYNLFLSAEKNNIKINLISAFRSVKKQEKIFGNKLKKVCKKEDILLKKCDEKINKILEVSAPPNYSKHHTGKALDFSCGDKYSLDDNFRKTECYWWLSKNDFENSKKFNFYPSYPDDKLNQGPNPEPWEFIWRKK